MKINQKQFDCFINNIWSLDALSARLASINVTESVIEWVSQSAKNYKKVIRHIKNSYQKIANDYVIDH